jgi:hypothetical protein
VDATEVLDHLLRSGQVLEKSWRGITFFQPNPDLVKEEDCRVISAVPPPPRRVVWPVATLRAYLGRELGIKWNAARECDLWLRDAGQLEYVAVGEWRIKVSEFRTPFGSTATLRFFAVPIQRMDLEISGQFVSTAPPATMKRTYKYKEKKWTREMSWERIGSSQTELVPFPPWIIKAEETPARRMISVEKGTTRTKGKLATGLSWVIRIENFETPYSAQMASGDPDGYLADRALRAMRDTATVKDALISYLQQRYGSCDVIPINVGAVDKGFARYLAIDKLGDVTIPVRVLFHAETRYKTYDQNFGQFEMMHDGRIEWAKAADLLLTSREWVGTYPEDAVELVEEWIEYWIERGYRFE